MIFYDLHQQMTNIQINITNKSKS